MKTFLFIILAFSTFYLTAQKNITIDTTHWEINAQSYILENFKGKNTIYLQNGIAILKDTMFLNGTIEFDAFLEGRRGFPGITFRGFDDFNRESFYMRPHQSGNPDSNQALSVYNNLSAWQLYYGPAYSSAYTYTENEWTHVKLVINGNKAQVFFDYSDEPHLSWYLMHTPKKGTIALKNGGAAVHFANVSLDKSKTELIDFKPFEEKNQEGIIEKWKVSDAFQEEKLQDISALKNLIDIRKWQNSIDAGKNGAADISKVVNLDTADGNTVFVKINIDSKKEQTKVFDFGYSDRTVAILNGQHIYKGNNGFRSRDYRYLGSIGLFDAIYLNLKKGKNTLLFAVSESFGGWGIIGKFKDTSGIKVE